MDQTVLTHGISRSERAEDALGVQVEELRRDGYTLIDSGLSEPQLAALRAGLEAVYRTQVEEIGGEDALRRCSDANTARCPLVYDDDFVDVAANPHLLALIRAMLGENFVLLQQNGLLNRPGNTHYQARWHRDLSYQHWISTEPIAVNALLALDPFTVSTGATCVVPGSHMHPEFPSDTFVRKHEKSLEAPPGTFLVLDAMLFHRAGLNVSQKPRRGLNHLIGRPFLGQQFDLPALLEGRYAEDPLLARYLGYRWGPAPDVTAWRKQRMSAS